MRLKIALIFILGIFAFHSSLYLILRFGNFDTEETIVAVLDTGVDRNHELLKGKVLKGYDFSSKDEDPMDEDGHGTHVAGIVSKISPLSKILPVRLIDENEPLHYKFAVPLLYAIVKGADVVNMSFTGEYHWLSQKIIDLGRKKGVIFVASTGNSSLEYVEYPAKYEGVLGIAAFEEENKVLYQENNLGEGTDFLAPGVNVNSSSLNNTYERKTGTSMSAAHVSGVIAKMKNEKNLSADEILLMLKEHRNKLVGTESYPVIDSNYFEALETNEVYIWKQVIENENGSEIELIIRTMNAKSVDVFADGKVLKTVVGDLEDELTIGFEDGEHEILTVATPSSINNFNESFENHKEVDSEKMDLKFSVKKDEDAPIDVRRVITDTENPHIEIDREWSDHHMVMVIKVDDFTLEKVKIKTAKKSITYEKNYLGDEQIYLPIKSSDFPIHIEAHDYRGNSTQLVHESLRSLRQFMESEDVIIKR